MGDNTPHTNGHGSRVCNYQTFRPKSSSRSFPLRAPILRLGYPSNEIQNIELTVQSLNRSKEAPFDMRCVMIQGHSTTMSMIWITGIGGVATSNY